MGGLFSILNQGHTGLSTSRYQINVTSQNVTNVNTPGYTRRVGIQSPITSPPPGGGGVQVTDIHRYVNEFLDQRVLLGISYKAAAESADSPLSQAESALAAEDGVGLDPASALAELFSALTRLESSPSDSALRQDVLSSAGQVCERINTAADGIQDARDEADFYLRDMAEQASEHMQKIAALNRQIGANPYEAAPDLRDQRNQHLQALAELIDIRVEEDHLGMVTVIGSGGINLVQGEVTGTLQAVTSVTLGGFAEINFVDNSGISHPVTHAIRGGAMGSLLEIRDHTMVELANDLDQYAWDLATSFNAVHSTGFGLDGATGRDLFLQPATVAGAAAAIAIDPSVDGNPDAVAAATDPLGVPGDNTNLHLLSAIETDLVALGGTDTLSGSYGKIMAKIGVKKSSNDSEILFRNDSLSQLESLREEVSGVSIDEEMISLVQYQRSYEAAAKVIQTTDEMLAKLMEL
ncbi:MAG: flagellar hook-associated protein FlgK [Deltaproteobacteria bacterium]|nr:flagellar hook-associated protein FlgK [Deltaproteobacteria bacterium]